MNSHIKLRILGRNSKGEPAFEDVIQRIDSIEAVEEHEEDDAPGCVLRMRTGDDLLCANSFHAVEDGLRASMLIENTEDAEERILAEVHAAQVALREEVEDEDLEDEEPGLAPDPEHF